MEVKGFGRRVDILPEAWGAAQRDGITCELETLVPTYNKVSGPLPLANQRVEAGAPDLLRGLTLQEF